MADDDDIETLRRRLSMANRTLDDPTSTVNHLTDRLARIENTVDTLEGDDGDPNRPTGWLTLEEYEQHYGDRPESDGTFTVNPGSRQ